MPSPMLSADLDAVYADPLFSSDVAFGAQLTKGHLNWTDTVQNDKSGGSVFVRKRILEIRTGTLTGLKQDSNVTIDGTVYVVEDINHRDDGLVTEVMVAT
jgi:hypothetical protein